MFCFKIVTNIQCVLCFAAICLLTAGCHVNRDDTTSKTRMVLADVLNVEYAEALPTATLGELGFVEANRAELRKAFASEFQVIVAEEDLDKIGKDARIENATIMDVANFLRTETK